MNDCIRCGFENPPSVGPTLCRNCGRLTSGEAHPQPDITQASTSQVDVALIRADLTGWRVAAAVSGAMYVVSYVLVMGMWWATAGDPVAQNAAGAIAVLLALPLLAGFVGSAVSLVALGIKANGREQLLGWVGLLALIISIGAAFVG